MRRRANDFGLAEQAQVGARHRERLVDAVEGDALRFDAAVDDRAGAGVAQR